MELTRTFSLNTAITPLDADGRYDETTHKNLVLPVRGKIMNNDGISGCHIARFTIQITYLTAVTDEETVTRVVQEAVAWATEQDNLFPFKHEKTPAIVLPEKSKPADKSKDPLWAYANFTSHVINFALGENGFDNEVFRAQTTSLVEALVNIDGILDVELRPGQAGLRFNPRIVSYEAIETHMRLVLTDAVHNGYFPFLNGRELQLTFFTTS